MGRHNKHVNESTELQEEQKIILPQGELMQSLPDIHLPKEWRVRALNARFRNGKHPTHLCVSSHEERHEGSCVTRYT